MGSDRAKILIVDDEQDVRDVLEFYLASLDVEVLSAVDGADAIKLLFEHKIDLLVTDIKMPRMDGIALLKEARSLGIEIPVVILTGHGDKELAIQAMRLGAVDFLDKPFSGEDLLHSIATFLEIEQRKNALLEQAGKLSPEAIMRQRRMIGLLRLLNEKRKQNPAK
jgi:DNA-binding NtrC family response regulator